MGPVSCPGSQAGIRIIKNSFRLSTDARASIIPPAVGLSESEKLKIEAAAPGALFFDETVSTNAVLGEMGRNGAREGTVAVADRQTGGRGRMGRKWISPGGGNLFMSVLFRPRVRFSHCPAATFMASLALCETFEASGAAVEIKWPNDILACGGKLAGVLSEAEPEGEMCNFIVIGIGANLNLAPVLKKHERPAVCLADITGSRVNRGDFAAALIKNLFAQRRDWAEKGSDWTVARWAARWGKLNGQITVRDGKTEITGVARKVDARGFLHIETPDGELATVVSGDAV